MLHVRSEKVVSARLRYRDYKIENILSARNVRNGIQARILASTVYTCPVIIHNAKKLPAYPVTSEVHPTAHLVRVENNTNNARRDVTSWLLVSLLVFDNEGVFFHYKFSCLLYLSKI